MVNIGGLSLSLYALSIWIGCLAGAALFLYESRNLRKARNLRKIRCFSAFYNRRGLHPPPHLYRRRLPHPRDPHKVQPSREKCC